MFTDLCDKSESITKKTADLKENDGVWRAINSQGNKQSRQEGSLIFMSVVWVPRLNIPW
jgi:hypothetical protein